MQGKIIKIKKKKSTFCYFTEWNVCQEAYCWYSVGKRGRRNTMFMVFSNFSEVHCVI